MRSPSGVGMSVDIDDSATRCSMQYEELMQTMAEDGNVRWRWSRTGRPRVRAASVWRAGRTRARRCPDVLPRAERPGSTGWRRAGRPGARGRGAQRRRAWSASRTSSSSAFPTAHSRMASRCGETWCAVVRRLRPEVVITMNFDLTWADDGPVNHADHRAGRSRRARRVPRRRQSAVVPRAGRPWQGITDGYVAAIQPTDPLRRRRRHVGAGGRVHSSSTAPYIDGLGTEVDPEEFLTNMAGFAGHGGRLRVRRAPSTLPDVTSVNRQHRDREHRRAAEQHGARDAPVPNRLRTSSTAASSASPS